MLNLEEEDSSAKVSRGLGWRVGRVVSEERVLNPTVQKPDRLAGKSKCLKPLLGVEGTVDFVVFCPDPSTKSAWIL